MTASMVHRAQKPVHGTCMAAVASADSNLTLLSYDEVRSLAVPLEQQ